MNYQSKEWLEKVYSNQGLSMRKIAFLERVDHSTILYWMKKHNIPRRSVSVACQGAGCSNWRGGRKHLSTGYIQIYSPDHPRADMAGYVMEHRLVLEKDLGRLLTQEENVHHINEIRDDNRKENLALFPTWERHMAFHKGIR